MKRESSTANQSNFGKKIMTPMLEDKVNRFVPVCHFCNRLGHICPKCCKYKKLFRMNKIEQLYSKPRTAPKIKIDLNDKPVKKLWIKNHIYFIMLLTPL